ncbi:MAG: hypothetical protein ABSG32_17825 [Terriglobia bacterium]|jgi:hypothetical protein
MNCRICSNPLSLIDRLAGRQEHSGCAREQQVAEAKAVQVRERKAEEEYRETQRLVEEKKLKDEEALDRLRNERMGKGIFKSLNTDAQMILDPGEQCCVLVKGCWSTLFYPRAAGRILPGQAVRVDGLKKIDFGVLHITDKRICFVGKGGAKTVAWKKILQCESHSDVLHGRLV